MAQVKEFVRKSNERIQKYEKDLEAIKNAMPLEEMMVEEFAYAYPTLALDPLNKPTLFPHDPVSQNTPEDIAYWRKQGIFGGPDKYHP